MIRAALAIAAAIIVIKDARHWRTGDKRHASFRTVVVSVLILLGLSIAAQARPSPYPPVTQFAGDRYSAQTQLGPEVARSVQRQRAGKARYLYPARKRAPARRQHWDGHPLPKPRPGTVAPLAGVVAPLAAKAREIVADCGSIVISGVRHTYIAGTGGRLSLHASGRAVDIKGNPACIARHLVGWPGGASTDYAAVNHTHISWAPGGPEWGSRFRHHRGGHRHRHRRRA